MEVKSKEDLEIEKSIIIATRIKLPFVRELIAYIVLLLLSLFFLYFGFFIFLLVFFLIGVGGFVELFFIYKNNHSQGIIITYKNNCFAIYNGIEKIFIKVEDIKDLSYKNKKSFIVTPYFFSEREYNYGKFYIFYLNDGQTFKMTLKNIAEPDKVYDKIVHILEWDQIEE